MAHACLCALVALLVCAAADARSSPRVPDPSASRIHVHPEHDTRMRWLDARSRMFKAGEEGGNETTTCNGVPFEGDTCQGVFQYKVKFNVSLPESTMAVTKSTDCFGKTAVTVSALGGLADGTVDLACTGVLRYSEKTLNFSDSVTNGSLLQYRCAFDFTYTATEATVDGKERGETFQNCKYLNHVISITASRGPEDAGLMESDMEEAADVLMDEALSAEPPSTLLAEPAAALFAHPASTLDYGCKSDVTCNGEATTDSDSCVGDWSDVEDCTGEGGGVTKTLCKGSWYPTPKSATCKGDFSTEFDISGDWGSFGYLSGCKGTMTTSWDVKAGMTFWTALCLGKNMYSSNYESGAAPAPSPYGQEEPFRVTRGGEDVRRAVGVVTVT